MGAGDEPAGFAPMGDEPPTPIGAPRDVTAPHALRFDGASRDFVLSADGTYESIHPVDQSVALALLIARGKLASAPDLGSPWREIPYTDGARLASRVDNIVRTALAELLRDGDIEIVGIYSERVNKNAMFAQVDYYNLRLHPKAKRSVDV